MNQSTGFPLFDFRSIPLSDDAKSQLWGTYDHVFRTGKVPSGKAGLLRLIANNAYDPDQGSYVPVAEDVYLTGKLPDLSRQIQGPVTPFHGCFFSNALAIPVGYGTAGYDRNATIRPIYRVTNIGLLVVTLEMDCVSTAQFEETLGWTRKGARDRSPLELVHDELRQWKDYRGYSVVFSGRRSLHYHFLSSTRHLEKAPWEIRSDERTGAHQSVYAAVLGRAHDLIWNHVHECFSRIVRPSIPLDDQMRSVTQWRRMPWAVRCLDKPSEALGLDVGTLVPQIMICETIATKSPRDSLEYLVPSNLAAATDRRSKRDRSASGTFTESQVSPEAILALKTLCRDEWGSDYPQPVDAHLQNGEWIIKFKNHADDQNPSSFVYGDYRMVIISGVNEFGERNFYLPGDMTADSLVELVISSDGKSQFRRDHESTSQRETSGGKFPNNFVNFLGLSRPIKTDPDTSPAEAARGNLSTLIGLTRGFSGDKIYKSVEGIGKTSLLMRELYYEIHDDAISTGAGKAAGFGCFAFRSLEQAEAKAREFMDSEYRPNSGAVVVKSFWKHYADACAVVQERPIPQMELRSSEDGVFLEIQRRLPKVFAALEHIRAGLWKAPGTFSPASTVLFMSHASAKLWHQTRTTRYWYHPRFDPNVPVRQQEPLRNEFWLSKITFDEPEIGDFLYRFTERQYNELVEAHDQVADWGNLRTAQKIEAHAELVRRGVTSVIIFDNFNEFMSIDMDSFQIYFVDYERIPFGRHGGSNDMYRNANGQRYYLSLKSWQRSSGAELIYLTTEDVITDVISQVYAVSKQHLSRHDLTDFTFEPESSNIFPIPVPLYLDKRASKRQIENLVAEISANLPDVAIIADVITSSQVTNFTRMKGANKFQNDDVIIILRFLNVDEYSLLNVTGQFLGQDDIIPRYYQDQISQACGRNRGFRESSERTTRTVIVASPGLYNAVLRKLDPSRYELRLVSQTPWSEPVAH